MLLCCISQLLLAQDYMSKSEYSKQSFKIDGYSNEWAQPFNFYDGDTKIRYSLRNDSANFYFCFQTWNEATEMRLMRAGMQIKLSAKSKKQKYFGSINFPITTKNPTASSTEHHSKHLDISGFKTGFVLQNNTMSIEGFKIQNGVVPIQSDTAISLAVNWDSTNTLNYEMRIPFKTFYGANYSMDDLLKTITLQVKVNAMDAPPSSGGEGGGMNGGGMGGGGMGGGGGGGMSGRGGGMHNMNNNGMKNRGGGGNRGEAGQTDLYSSASFKQKFQLSFTPNPFQFKF